MRLFVVAACLLAVAASAQTAKVERKASGAQAPTEAVKDLPVRKVVLYKNGVGYFEHAGTVTGNQKVAIDFTSPQLNDVLQSLTVLDEGGGRIAGVNYNSTTPLAEQLKTLSLGMTDDPTSTELFGALRGQRVEVTGGPGGVIAGRLMSIESRSEKVGTRDATVDKFYLTVVANSGAVRVIELTPALSVRPLDASLQGQIDRYLELLSSTHSTGLRHLTLDALGQGPRELRVSYISEVPVWKATYRIVFPRAGAGGKAIMQGWAVVDNTVGADWDHVQLALVAGAPQSFIQPLSQPIYTHRPEIPIATSEQTAPQTHESAEMKAAPRPSAAQPAMAMALKGRNLTQSVTVDAESLNGATGTGNGYGAGSGGSIGGGLYRAAGVDRPTDAIQPGDVSTNAFDDFFEYALTQPVTIKKNESAMVPILQQELPAEHVTLWSDKERWPLRAVWLENTSKLTLDSGSFSIFESGEFAGEGLLDPIHPGEKRLLSYAVDQAVKVHHGGYGNTRTLRHIAMHEGILVESTTEVSESTYTVNNAADEARTVIVEHARRANAELDSESKPAETTPTAYRFKVAVGPHGSVDLHVGERATVAERIRIDPDTDRTEFLLNLTKLAPSTLAKLQPLMDAETALSDLNFKAQDLLKKQNALAADEQRDRDNLNALKGSEAAKRFVEELNRTEDDLIVARKEQTAVEQKRLDALARLNDLIRQLAFDEDVDVVTQSNQFGDRKPVR